MVFSKPRPAPFCHSFFFRSTKGYTAPIFISKMESRYKHGKYPFRSYIPRYLTTSKGCQRLHTPDYHMNQPNTAIIFTQRYAIKINRVVGQQSHIHANVWRLLPPQGSLLEISLSKPCSPLFCSTIHDYSNEQRINITLVGSVGNTL